MTEVAWAPSDITRFLRTKGASQGAIDAAGRIKRMRATIEELRSEDATPIPWLSSRASQLATFYSLLANWVEDRELLWESNGVDYTGGEE
jgi:hypothetical protein